MAQNELTPDPLFPAFTEDWQKTNTQQIVIAAGYEKRQGKSRVQGIYGGEVIFGLSGSSQTYQYGNPISQDFNAPITNNFGNNILAGNSTAATSRKVEEGFVGARGFIGVEYFVGPKISIGAEFGYSFLFRNASRGF